MIDGHEISLLEDGTQVFPSMLADIDRAARVVLLEMYWIGADAVGVAFRHALTDAARRGCAVRIIQDGFGSWELPDGFWDELIAAGGQVRTFHALSAVSVLPVLGSLARRDHRKLLLVDQEVAYVGGLNLAAPWLPPSQGGEPGWRDTALRLAGKAVAEALASVFEETWRYIREPTDMLVASASPLRPAPKLTILVNTPQHRSGRVIRRMYLWAIHQAHRSIDITAAYFAPRPLFVHALIRAQRRGVRVRILLPSRSDVLLADLASAPIVRYLVRQGVFVYAYQGRTLHAKTAVVDGSWVTVGSHNLDALSWAWNLECNVGVQDERLGQALTQSFERDLNTSKPYRCHQEKPGLRDRISDALGNVLLAGSRWL